MRDGRVPVPRLRRVPAAPERTPGRATRHEDDQHQESNQLSCQHYGSNQLPASGFQLPAQYYTSNVALSLQTSHFPLQTFSEVTSEDSLHFFGASSGRSR
jgi:hypothetical protein